MEHFLREDGIGLNGDYERALPGKSVSCHLHIKSLLTLAGMPWFAETFNILGGELSTDFVGEWEGRNRTAGDVITFALPFSAAIRGERVALNLLQRASSVATMTRKFVALAAPHGIAILDTRKTTPGLRMLEKYACRQGGGHNHRFHQCDMWMVKDNHKTFFGGIREAVAFFEKRQPLYTPIVVEVHTLDELDHVLKLADENGRVRHLMLDNFSSEQLQLALKKKTSAVTYEISGGITLDNIGDYLRDGVDAISIGSMTSFPPPVDISLKFTP